MFKHTGIGVIPKDWEHGTYFVRVITEFLKLETFILKENLNERTISHKLAEYLQRVFPNYDVDCEYNKMPFNGDAKEYINKTLELDAEGICSDDEKGLTVYPDIIVHKRGNNKDNYLVIEVKKKEYAEIKRKWEKETYKEFDFRKLKAYTKQLDYGYGIYLEFDKDNISDLKFFKEGQLLNESTPEWAIYD